MGKPSNPDEGRAGGHAGAGQHRDASSRAGAG
eukprot:SAG31_NODE_35294_length_324_cov_1.146667_2_plen_31_part_01